MQAPGLAIGSSSACPIDDLVVANTGRPLTEADVVGLCGTGAGTKAVQGGIRRASIGHKGMGFKSVLDITDAPEVQSVVHGFRMDRGLATAAVTKILADIDLPAPSRVPVMRFPWPLLERLDDWPDLHARGFNVRFRFPLRETVTADRRENLATGLLDLPVTASPVPQSPRACRGGGRPARADRPRRLAADAPTPHPGGVGARRRARRVWRVPRTDRGQPTRPAGRIVAVPHRSRRGCRDRAITERASSAMPGKASSLPRCRSQHLGPPGSARSLRPVGRASMSSCRPACPRPTR